MAATVTCSAYLLSVGGLTEPREGYVATAFAVVAVILLLLGKPAAGNTEALALASAKVPFRLKVTATWVAIFFILGIFLVLSDLDRGFIRENFRYIARWPQVHDPARVLRDHPGDDPRAARARSVACRTTPSPTACPGFYTSFFRGTPLIVQLFLIYLALPQIGFNLDRTSLVNILTLTTFVAGVIGLGLNYGAYMTEIFRAGIQSVGHGQAEAADALGMTYGQRMRRVVLPQAIRVIIPPTGNEFIAMMKDTALVGFLGAAVANAELFLRATARVQRQRPNRLESLLVAAALYWMLTSDLHVLPEPVGATHLEGLRAHRSGTAAARAAGRCGCPAAARAAARNSRDRASRRGGRAVSDDPVVKVENLHKYFGALEVLKGIDMEVRRGEVVVIFGRSGSGKSTLLRCINFLEDPTYGAIEVAGVRLEGGHRTRHKREQIRQLRIHAGMVFQQFNLFPHMTALQNVMEGPDDREGHEVGHDPARGARAAGEGGPGRQGRSSTRSACPGGSSSGSRSPERWRWSPT